MLMFCLDEVLDFSGVVQRALSTVLSFTTCNNRFFLNCLCLQSWSPVVGHVYFRDEKGIWLAELAVNLQVLRQHAVLEARRRLGYFPCAGRASLLELFRKCLLGGVAHVKLLLLVCTNRRLRFHW